MAHPRLSYLSEAERELLHEETLRVLKDVGVAFNSRQAIEVLAEAGAWVDRERLVAKLDWELIEGCLQTVPRQVLLAGRLPENDRLLGGERLVATSDGMATYVYDDLTGERRAGTAADLATMMRLADALDEIDVLWPSPQAGDIDPLIQPLQMNAICLRNSTKHIQDEVRDPSLVEPMLAIYEAAIGTSLDRRPVFSVTNCTVAPLQHEAAMTEASMMLCRRGVPIFVLPMPQGGTTGPMSVFGTCVIALAELLSAVVLFQLVQPGCAVISGVAAAMAELHSGGYLSGGPEVGLINAVCLEMSRFYGLPTQATGVTSDAKACSMQAGAEGMMSGLAAALAGADSLIAAGCLDSTQNHSLAKMVLDAETVGMIRRFMRREELDSARLLIDDVLAVGIGGHYLGRKSTRRLQGHEIWHPSVYQRAAFEEYRGRTLKQDAVARARDLLATHRVPPLSDAAESEIASIIAAVQRRG